MHEWQSLSHVRWECKYHVVIIPKYRRKVFFGRLLHRIGAILLVLCRRRGIDLLEGLAMGADAHKKRVTFSYLVAKQLGRLDAL